MGKYFLSYLVLFNCLFSSESFIFNKLFRTHIQKVNDNIVSNNGIFNPFEKHPELHITDNIIQSCQVQENTDKSVDLLNFRFIQNVNQNINNQLPVCESKPYYLKTVPELIAEIKTNIIMNNLHEISDKISNLIDFDHKTKISKPLIKYSSSLLPAMDGIAHHVLTANQNFINFVLDNDILSLEIKKKLVLFSIQAAQNGDSTGGQILEFYYNMVNHLL